MVADPLGVRSPMVHVITSDLHLGSPHAKCDAFRAFLRAVPDGATLVLNGDTLDDPRRPLPPEHETVLADLRSSSPRVDVVWVVGNHDEGSANLLGDSVPWQACYAVGNRLHIAHGDYFDNVMPYNRWFIKLFKRTHALRVRLGAPPVHVAEYAKRWRRLYQFLRRNVLMNAVGFAREHGYGCVCCGHTHYVEEQEVDGIRYLNTGSWTESRFSYVWVDDASIRLLEYVPGGGVTPEAADERHT